LGAASNLAASNAFGEMGRGNGEAGRLVTIFDLLPVLSGAGLEATASLGNTAAAEMAWWVWPLLLFLITVLIGIVAVLGGIGGGVLLTPLVGAFFPFNMDFVRSIGLLSALAGALSSSPGLLRQGLANFRLALPAALIASISSIIGAYMGLILPEKILQILMGGTIIFVAFLFMSPSGQGSGPVTQPDPLARALRISGYYRDPATGDAFEWTVHRTPIGLLLFVLIGIVAGMFGLGAGWANVPVLNLVMGVPLKLAVGTSAVIISVSGTSAVWIYLNQGAFIPFIAVPCVLGMMVGARLGSKLLGIVQTATIRKILIAVLLVAGIRPLLQGLGIWP